MPRRKLLILGLFALALGLAAAVHLLTGDPLGGLHWPETTEFLAGRLRRVSIATGVGAALALAGVQLQALLRNPLASPDILGITSGAGLGVAAATFVGSRAGNASPGPGVQTLAGLVGAALTLAVILGWSKRRGGIDVISLVLVGVVIGMTCSGATLLLHQLLPDGGVSARLWFLGSIDESVPVWLIALSWLIIGACVLTTMRCARAMDASTFSEDEARALGVRVGRLRLTLLLTSGILTTISVVLAGPIGFVGLIVPHAVRMVLGPHHAPLAIGATLAGGACMLLADAGVSAIPLSHTGRIPVGVVTAIVGGPLFLLLLRSTLKHRTLP
ncbi:MAG: iron ABC transporter permease [Phycisphaerales bacterium]|nr:iron ABC transporter permease [Phycisphaerales bacterium]